MAGLASSGNRAVVKDNGLEIVHDMTRITFTLSRDMRLVFACGHDTVVADTATSGNAGMIISAVCSEFDKPCSIVTVVTFHTGGRVLIGFTNGPHTVVTLTAGAKYFQVIYEGNNAKPERGMAGLAQITGSKMIWRFTRNGYIRTVMAIHTL